MRIWCPFDTEDSLFVKLFRQAGYQVIATHIANGQDFFTIDPPKCDYIISNPPYSVKGEVLQRLFDLGIAKTDQDILQEAMLLIRAFCAERHFTIYYTRIWNSGGKTIFDVGSHSEFFHLIPEVQFHEDK